MTLPDFSRADTPHQPTFTLEDIITATQGKPLGSAQPLNSPVCLSTDTRDFQNNQGIGRWFIPICGERFDGHTFIDEAYTQGIEGVLVQADRLEKNPHWDRHANVVVVADTTQAYLDLASFHRQRFNAKVVALTGSSGKTTVKEMLYAAFSPILRTQKTDKNNNNEIGVSQTLLNLQPDTELLIVEMGMRGLNQIRPLTLAAKPDVAIVINVGPAHIGLLGSLENIALAKSEIWEGLNPETGIAIFNDDDPLVRQRIQQVASKVPLNRQGFSLKQAKDIQYLNDGTMAFTFEGNRFQLAVQGEHYLSNALAVLAVARALSINIADLALGLANFQPGSGRGSKVPIVGLPEVYVVNDAYNANPQSMKAALSHCLLTEKSPLILILSGMKELGTFSDEYHQELGKWLALMAPCHPNLRLVMAIGEETKPLVNSLYRAVIPVAYYDTTEAAVNGFQSLLADHQIPLNNLCLYLKGSRAYGLEQFLDQRVWQSNPQNPPQEKASPLLSQ